MKFVVFLALFALAFAQGPPPPQYQLHIPDKCEDVFSVKVCDRFRKTAAALKLKSEEVRNAVIDAYKQGKTKAEEMEKAVNDFLVNKVLNKKCEDLTTQENCDKLRALAKNLKVQADKVKEFIVKEIANLKTKKCEDFLSADQCNKLEKLAKNLKIKAEKLKDLIVAAYLDAKTKGTQVVVETYEKVKNYVKSIRCEDAFNPELCAAFRKYAEKTKVALPRIMETAVDLVKKGVAVGKGLVEKVFNIVDYFYDCNDVFDDDSCDRIKRWAAKLKVTYEKVEQLVKKYVRTFIEKSTSIYQTIKDYVKEKIYCRFSPPCHNVEDDDEIADLAINKRSIFGDWKNKMMEILNNKFPNLEANIRQQVQDIINKSKTFFQFMKNLATKIKTETKEQYNKLVEALKKMMVEAVL